MRTLIADDELTSRMILQKNLSPYGSCDVAVTGKEAIQAFGMAINSNQPYDLICLDIMMPEIDGITALKKMREIEDKFGIPKHRRSKIIMTTALDDSKSVMDCIVKYGCNSYILKPIDKNTLKLRLKEIGLI